MRFNLCFLVTLFVFLALIDVAQLGTPFRLDVLREEDIVGLEEFLSHLEPDVRDAVLDLLEAKEIPDQELANRIMKKIMRKLPRKIQEDLFDLYVKTLPQ
ncbi:unnamed protein product [Auanema sp. JU1783]|nr:unnamed protein product [Auanema sp. JU1783]